MKKILIGSLAFILASTFTVSSTVFATEATTSAIETVDLQEVQSKLGTVQAETPSLVPGDFFYFSKIALEKIKLALTFDNSKEAKLLAEYASERLAEASVLYGEGKEEEALEVIQTALKYIENSQSIIDEETAAVDGSEEPDAAVEEDAIQDDSMAAEDTNTNDQTDNDPSIDGQTDESVSVEGNYEEQDQYSEAQDTLRNNIAALSAAMQHVGNDNAKAALQRNIEKTRAKIQKKLAKLEKKYGEALVENQEADLNETKSLNVNSEEAAVIPNTNTDTVALPDDNMAVPMEDAEKETSAEPGVPAVSAPTITHAPKGLSKEKHEEKREKKENHKENKENGNKKE